MFCPLLACLSSHFCGQSDFCASEEGRESLTPPQGENFLLHFWMIQNLYKKSNSMMEWPLH